MISDSISYFKKVFELFSIIFLFLKLNLGDCKSKLQKSNEKHKIFFSKFLNEIILYKFKDSDKSPD